MACCARVPDVLSGILNGIDETVWDPANDPHLAARFDVRRLNDRVRQQSGAAERFGLERRAGQRRCSVSSAGWRRRRASICCSRRCRRCSPAARSLPCWGRATPSLEAGLRAAAAGHPGRVGVQFGYDEALAHLIQGGCDALLVPSRFEPCGLTQLCALRYGALPIVAHVGGLCDTVIDANEMALAAGVGTGFHFAPVDEPRCWLRRSCAHCRCGGSRRSGGGCNATPCRPTLAGATRPRVMPRCIASWRRVGLTDVTSPVIARSEVAVGSADDGSRRGGCGTTRVGDNAVRPVASRTGWTSRASRAIRTAPANSARMPR